MFYKKDYYVKPVKKYAKDIWERDEYKNKFAISLNTDVKIIGSFLEKDIECVVFVCTKMSDNFPIKRLEMGIRWWYDYFWEVNGGKKIEELAGILEIIEILGLDINYNN